jgi:hypothetical protein
LIEPSAFRRDDCSETQISFRVAAPLTMESIGAAATSDGKDRGDPLSTTFQRRTDERI